MTPSIEEAARRELLDTNDEYRTLHEEHQDSERRLVEISTKTLLSEEDEFEDSDQRKGDGICTTNMRDLDQFECQDADPSDFCFCGSAEEIDGFCFRVYDPFESPEDAADRGVPNPYDCYIEGHRRYIKSKASISEYLS